MIKHLLLLTFLSACLVMGAQAQLKFGVAAGYEHLTSTPSNSITSSGGFAGSLLLRYTISPHIELDWALTIGGWKTPTFQYYPPHAMPPYPYVYPNSYARVDVLHVVIPIYVCYVLPLKNYSLFGGPGFFWSATSMTGAEESSVNSYGLSLLAGIRWRHWQIAADYRPVMHNYEHFQYYGDGFDGRLSNDVSLKIGLFIGRYKKKK
jgi:hypothetical protein